MTVSNTLNTFFDISLAENDDTIEFGISCIMSLSFMCDESVFTIDLETSLILSTLK